MQLMNIVFCLIFILLSGCANLGARPDADALGDNSQEQALSLVEIIEKGDDSARSGDFESAQISYALAVERDPDNIEALYKLAFVHKRRRSLGVAETLLRHLLLVDKNNEQGSILLGEVLLQSENFEQAKSVFTEILQVNSKSTEALNSLGVIYDLNADHSIAQEFFEQALTHSPRSSKYANNLGYSYYLEGRLIKAENLFHRALEFDSNYARAWSNLALLYSRVGRYQEANAAFGKIVEDHQAANNIGYLGVIEGNEKVARKYLGKAIEISPTYYELANRNIQLVE